jgi:dihydroneopterin aldolase
MDRQLDRITIRGVRGYGYHGVLPAEREIGQEFVVDVVLLLKTHRAAKTDELTDTVDYGEIAVAVHQRITGEPYALLESLAGRIAADCLEDYAVQEVQVTVHKPQAPVPVPFDDIEVRVTRSR